MLVANGTVMLQTVSSQHSLIDEVWPPSLITITVTRTMPVGNGGKFTPEARAIYELVLEMQKVSSPSLSSLPSPCLTVIILALVRSPETRFTLGRYPTIMPSHSRPWVPETRHLQVFIITGLRVLEL